MSKQIIDRYYSMIIDNQKLSCHKPFFTEPMDILERRAREIAEVRAQLTDAAVLKHVPRWGMVVWKSPLPERVRRWVLKKALSRVEVREYRQADPLMPPETVVLVDGVVKEKVKHMV